MHDAWHVNGGSDGVVDARDWGLHILTLPWKLFFALVPPTDFAGGWVCFCVALAFIGIVTAVIGDLAALFGCMIGMQPAVTAITFVALGTSLPDTFASMAAAQADAYADASIGNVTGSNSVNVFLGLGLPWLICAIKWQVSGPSTLWLDTYTSEFPDLVLKYEENAAFLVPAGDLAFSVIVFCICALMCIGTRTIVVRETIVLGPMHLIAPLFLCMCEWGEKGEGDCAIGGILFQVLFGFLYVLVPPTKQGRWW